MKVFNIDYVAAEGVAPKVDAIKGYTSEEQAGAAPLKEGSVRLQARAATDLASLGEPILAVLAAFKSPKGKDIAATPEAIWEALNPSPKKDISRGLPAGKKDGTSSSSPDEKAGSTEGQKPGKKDRMKKPAKKKAAKKSDKTKGANGSPRGEKTLKVKALLERAKGCTSAEVKEATGWPAVSMPAMAKACGLKLRKEKVQGKPTQYFGS